MTVLNWIHLSGYVALAACALCTPFLRRTLGLGLLAGGAAFIASAIVLHGLKPHPFYVLALIGPAVEETARRIVAHKSLRNGDLSFASTFVFSFGFSYGDWSRNLIGAALRMLDSDWSRALGRIESAFHVLSLHFLLTLVILAPPLFGRRLWNFIAALSIHIAHNAALAYMWGARDHAMSRWWDYSTIVLVAGALLVFAGSQRAGRRAGP